MRASLFKLATSLSVLGAEQYQQFKHDRKRRDSVLKNVELDGQWYSRPFTEWVLHTSYAHVSSLTTHENTRGHKVWLPVHQ